MIDGASYSPEMMKKLAWAVISQTTEDYELALTGNPEKVVGTITTLDCYNFLAGKTQIARFWLSTAGLAPVDMDKKALERVIIERFYAGIWDRIDKKTAERGNPR